MAIARIRIKDSDELRKIVVDDVSAVENGLEVISENMPMDTKEKIDVLCHDDKGQIVILKLSAKEDDHMFFEGLKILSHVTNIKPLLKFTYKDFKINEKEASRLIFLAPSFSPQLIDVVGQMQGIQMDLYTWEYFEFDGKRALHLETVWQSEATKSKPRKSTPTKPKSSKVLNKDDKKKPETEPITEEVVMPPGEVDNRLVETETKERTKKKSIFSL
jgi:hypothetical protein